MSKNRTIILLTVMILLLIFTLGIACTPQQRPAPRDNDPGVGDTRMEQNDRNNRNVNDNQNQKNIAAQKNAKRLAEKIVDQVQGINSATVVFAEEVAYVGIDLHANLSGNEAEDVKNKVAQVVKEDDPDIETVFVTEDADTFTRLQKIGRDIEDGRPITGFLDELQNMFKRVTPSMD